MAVFVEVNGVAEPEDEEANGNNSAEYDDPRSIFNAGSVLFVAGLKSLSIGLLSFHNF